jgi:uncharacterized 2Fe-2S/4Fe-4S cluster protein (DUF4445 family)
LSLAPRDVEELLKVKAACNLAVERLLAESGLRPPEVVTIFLGGALGSHLPPRHLEGLGFFPSGWAGRCRAAGNTSLAGARLFLALAEAREFAERLPERTRVTDLVSDPGFSRAFVSAMCFEYVSGGLG